MADILTRSERSKRMRKVRQKGTSPELVVRRMILDLGFRYRSNVRHLPGSPDLVFRRMRSVVFVHGCFWHAHRCRQGRKPSSRREYWLPKLENNRRRDRKNQRLLKDAGWRTLIIWQCQLKKRNTVATRLARFLEDPPQVAKISLRN
jgi:DNA mismatch endonuclease (patch repair protein)